MKNDQPVKTIYTEDHLGNTYSSTTAMCKHYGIDTSVFLYRMNKMGLSLERALTDPRIQKPGAMSCTDHLGNQFKSKVEMCDYWRIPRMIYFRRIRDGWTTEKALTEPILRTRKTNPVVYDHKHNAFDTIDKMCEHYNISKTQYMKNIRNNCTIEEALTTVTDKNECTDHLGNQYKSINELCRAYNITKTTLRSRIELGWTLREILENPNKKRTYSKVKDHNGKEFESVKEMCRSHGVTEFTFRHRIASGLTLEQCLSPENQHIIKCEDHLGNKFDSILDMCIYWNVSTSTFYHRQRKLKWSLEKTLTTISEHNYNTFGPNLKIVKPIQHGFYEVIFNNEHMIWSQPKIYDYYHDCMNIKLNKKG